MAADYTGTLSEIDVGTWNLGAVGKFTLGGWVKFDAFGIADARIFSEADGTATEDHNLMFGHVSSDSEIRWRVRLNCGGVTETFVSATDIVAADTWYHFALEYDDDDGDAVRLYVNGSITSINATHGTGGTLSATAKQTYLGNNEGAAKAMDGHLAEVFLMTDILENWEREALFNGAGIMQVHPGNIKAYWPLWFTPGGTDMIADLSGNARHGTEISVNNSAHPPVGRYAPAPLWTPVPIVGGGGGGLGIPIAAYHYNHHLRSMTG